MNLSAPDYKKIYRVQDNALSLIVPVLDEFYLTGGTVLGRFYLNHRYSDDLDFFTHRDKMFTQKVRKIFHVLKLNFKIDESTTFVSPDFVRITIIDESSLKLDFVNDIAGHCGETIRTKNNIPIDNVANILANKLTDLVSRDEPKDVFDIIAISCAITLTGKKFISKRLKNKS